MSKSYDVPIIIPENRHEVTHADPRGDWRVAYFDLELDFLPQRDPERASRNLEKKYRETVENWARMMHAEGWIPTTKPMLRRDEQGRPAAHYVPEPDCEDKRRFYIAARFKREHPELYPLDTVAMLNEVGPVNQVGQLNDFFRQMDGFSPKNPHTSAEEIGKQAKEDLALPEKARQEEEAVKRLDYKLTHRD